MQMQKSRFGFVIQKMMQAIRTELRDASETRWVAAVKAKKQSSGISTCIENSLKEVNDMATMIP